jgi:hypothetical protein
VIALLGALALLCASPAASQGAVNFQVKGKWTCNNRGNVIPIAGARVELWREISFWPDDKLGAEHTGSDGSFNFNVQAGSNFDLYAQLVLDDDRGVDLGDWYSFSPWETQTDTTGSHSGVVNLGTWQISKDNGAGTPKCAIWQGGHNAYADYKKVVGANPPEGDYSISSDFPCCGTPFTTLDTTRWPSGYQTGPGFSVNFHEFAHSVRHSFDGNTLHFLGDVARFGYARNHSACLVTNEGFAFNEGWAEYWANTPNTCGDGSNFQQEGNVATALTGLQNCKDRPSMVRVLRESPGAIHGYSEFRTRFFQIFGQRACLTPPITGVDAVEPSLSSDQLTRDVRGQISAQKKLIAGLSRQLRGAKGDARHPGRCTARRCLGALENLIEPSALSAQIQQAKLVLSRLRDGLAEARKANFAPDVLQRKYFDTLGPDRRAFERANQAILIDGLKESIKEIKSEPGFRRARSTGVFRTLDRRLSELTRLRKRRRATRGELESLYSAPASSVLDVAKRVRTR